LFIFGPQQVKKASLLVDKAKALEKRAERKKLTQSKISSFFAKPKPEMVCFYVATTFPFFHPIQGPETDIEETMEQNTDWASKLEDTSKPLDERIFDTPFTPWWNERHVPRVHGLPQFGVGSGDGNTFWSFPSCM
jgi:hypothetical protein